MTALYSDTNPEMEALQIQLWRQASPTRKMDMLAHLNQAARLLALAGLCARYPQTMVRTTQDADIVAEMRLEQIPLFVSALRDEFYLDEMMIAHAIQNNTSFNIIHRESMFKVDVFIPRRRPFLQSQLARAQTPDLYI
jgi:predicted Zn-dependent protease